MQKFIITMDGELRFGDVRLHKELIPFGGSDCYGGGFWGFTPDAKQVELYGSSFDFGPACFDMLKTIDWTGIDRRPHSLIYYPYYPSKHDGQVIRPTQQND